MNDRERGTALIISAMQGALAAAITRLSMSAGRAPTQEECDFIGDIAVKGAREISDFCYDRGIEPMIMLSIHGRAD